MKKLLYLSISILFVTNSFSQTYEDDLDLIQSLYGMEKKEVVDEFVELDKSKRLLYYG